MDGSDLPYHSGPVVWGERYQHTFYQLIIRAPAWFPANFWW